MARDVPPRHDDWPAGAESRRTNVIPACPIVPCALSTAPRDELDELAVTPRLALPDRPLAELADVDRPALTSLAAADHADVERADVERVADAELERLLAASDPVASSSAETPDAPTLDARSPEPGPQADAELVAAPETAGTAELAADDLDSDPAAQSAASPPEAEHEPHKITATEPEPAAAWPRPRTLIAELEGLHEDPAIGSWADIVLQEVALLQTLPSLDSPDAAASLDRLARLSELGKSLEKQIESPDMRTAALRARYALDRRIAVWRPVWTIAAAGPAGVPADELDAAALVDAMVAVDKILQRSDHQDGWRQFFRMDQLLAAAESDDPAYAEVRRLTREVLARMESSQLAPSHREFLDHPVFDPVKEQLRLWAAEPVDYADLLRLVEDFENDPTAIVAGRIADLWNRLRWAPQPETAELTRALNTYYRNANLRVAVSGELLNRLLPIVQDMEEDVNENILGSRVVGRSRTSTELSVRLIPDPHRWRLGLEARGDVDSQTQARVGLVRLFNRGESSYLARQVLQVGQQGIELDEPEAGADAATEVTGVQTDVDGLPLLSSLVRGIARSQAESRRHEASREVENRIAWRARRRMAEEVTSRVSQAEEKFDEKVLSPLKALELEPITTQMMTTDQRLISRARLAGYQQLGSNTPRPRAASDSLLSVQIHQSAANNVIEQLCLDGEEYELHELYRNLAGRFIEGEVEVPEDLPTGVTLRFADEEAVSVRFDDGQVELTIRMASIESGRSTWRDFEIRGYYRPETTSRNADLVRDGTLELIGEKLGFRDKIALRAIFSKVLSKKRKLQLIHERLMHEPRLEDVAVSQFVIDNGWIGVALASREGHPDLVARPAAGVADRR